MLQQSGFRLLTVAVLMLIFYMILSITFCYKELHLYKPESLTDLPRFSKVFWIPFAAAIFIYYLRQSLIAMVKPFLTEIVKD